MSNFILVTQIDGEAMSWVVLGEFIFMLLGTMWALPYLTTFVLVAQMLVLGVIDPVAWANEVTHGQEAFWLLMSFVPFVMIAQKSVSFFFLRLMLWSPVLVISLFLMYTINGGLSSIVDALTIITIALAVSQTASRKIKNMPNITKDEVAQFELFSSGIIMATAIGSTVFGVLLKGAEPYNPIAAKFGDVTFAEFFWLNLPSFLVSYVACLLVLFLVTKVKWFSKFGYQNKIPQNIKSYLKQEFIHKKVSAEDKYDLMVEGIAFLILFGMLIFTENPLYVSGLVGLGVLCVLKGADYIVHWYDDKEDHADVDKTPEKHEFLSGFFGHVMPFVIFAATCLFGVVAMLKEHKTFERPITHALKYFEDDKNAQVTSYSLMIGGLTTVSENMFTCTIACDECDRAIAHGLIKGKDAVDTMREKRKYMVAILAGATLLSLLLFFGQAPLLYLALNSYARSIGLSPLVIIRMCFPFAITLLLVVPFYIYFGLDAWVNWVHDVGLVKDVPIDMQKILERVNGSAH